MQHPDEGTIHSWLDGALSADETARLEAHVKECPRCAAAVAEVRGFIAGASRILTALDNAPRGVIPAAAPRMRVDPWVWRVAATVLVVAAGTLLVARNPRGNEQAISGPADSASMVQQSASTAVRVPLATEPVQIGADTTTPKEMASNAPTSALGRKGARDSSSGIAVRENKVLGKRDAVQASPGIAASGYAEAAAPTVSTLASGRVTDGPVTLDAVRQSEPLKVAGTPQRIGVVKVTLYEVAPGDTVTLTEPVAISPSSAVITGISSAQMARQATEKTAPAPSRSRPDVAAITSASASSRAAGAPPSAASPAAPALLSQQGTANALHTIIWTDSATGNTLTLAGRMPEARLQEIKIRIERERAAAAKRSP